jgi:hypothetical protein
MTCLCRGGFRSSKDCDLEAVDSSAVVARNIDLVPRTHHHLNTSGRVGVLYCFATVRAKIQV